MFLSIIKKCKSYVYELIIASNIWLIIDIKSNWLSYSPWIVKQ